MALWFLAVYLLIWTGSAQGLSFVSILMDSSYQMILSGNNDQIRLILHHPGYQDEHELLPGHSAKEQAGPPDRMRAAGSGDHAPPDHEFYLSDHE